MRSVLSEGGRIQDGLCQVRVGFIVYSMYDGSIRPRWNQTYTSFGKGVAVNLVIGAYYRDMVDEGPPDFRSIWKSL